MRRSHLITAVTLLAVSACAPKAQDHAPVRSEGVSGRDATWSAFYVTDGFAPSGTTKAAKGTFDRVRSGMTLRELTEMLGKGWMSQYEGCGIITWLGEDGRKLQVWPTTYGPDEMIDAGPRQLGGAGGRGRMWMSKLGADGELQDLAISPN